MDVWRVGNLKLFDLGFGADFFRSLKRGTDGKFNDTELAAIIKNAYVVFLDSCARSADNITELSIQPRPLELVALLIS